VNEVIKRIESIMAIRILIADDQRLLRDCFRDALEMEEGIEVVGTASDGQEALLLAEKELPDVILMDLAMPNLDGLRATRHIRDRLPDTKILILSLHNESSRVEKAVQAGIAGFVSKDVALDELVRIIKAVHGGEEIRSPFLVDQRLAQSRVTLRHKFTPREVKALRLLVQGHNNAEIAEMLCVSEPTIKKEFVDLFERLGVRNRTQAAVKGVQMGLLDGGADEGRHDAPSEPQRGGER
jgi:DNA-binding NarL/FixJ family response regulator